MNNYYFQISDNLCKTPKSFLVSTHFREEFFPQYEFSFFNCREGSEEKTSRSNLSPGPQVPWLIVLQSTPKLIKMQIHPKLNEAGCRCRSHFLRNEFSRFRAETFFSGNLFFKNFPTRNFPEFLVAAFLLEDLSLP